MRRGEALLALPLPLALAPFLTPTLTMRRGEAAQPNPNPSPNPSPNPNPNPNPSPNPNPNPNPNRNPNPNPNPTQGLSPEASEVLQAMLRPVSSERPSLTQILGCAWLHPIAHELPQRQAPRSHGAEPETETETETETEPEPQPQPQPQPGKLPARRTGSRLPQPPRRRPRPQGCSANGACAC